MEHLKKRNKQLDLLKILATFAVVKLHSGAGEFTGRIIQYMCGYAVPIFFMVSGALILSRSDKITKEYVLKRACRILKLIFVWNILLVIAMIIKNRALLNPFTFFIKSIFQLGLLWHFWYLWALLFLTICSPIIWKILQNKRHTKIYITILFFVCCAISLICVYEGSNGRNNLEACVPQSMRMWSHLLYYSLGGILFRYCQFDQIKNCFKKHGRFILTGMLFFSIGIAMVQYCICNGITHVTSPEYCFSNPIIALYNILLFECIVNLRNYKVFDSKIFDALCFDSLGIYILHPFFIAVLQKSGIWALDNWIQNFVILCLLCLPLVELMRRIPYVKNLIRL